MKGSRLPVVVDELARELVRVNLVGEDAPLPGRRQSRRW
jgi:hypothetical protein